MYDFTPSYTYALCATV